MNKVVVSSKYNKEMHKKFYMFHMFRRSFSFYFVIALAIFVTYIAIKQTIANQDDSTTIIAVWLLTALTIIITPSIMVFRIFKATKTEAKERGETIEILEFTKDKILRRISGESKIVLGWHNMEAIYETKEAFLIYLMENQGLVVDKNCITEGNVELLRKLITNNMKPNKKGKIAFKKVYKGE